VPNLGFMSFDLSWRKGAKERITVRWQDGGAHFCLTLAELEEELEDHGVGPRVRKSLCAYHGREMLGQIRKWIDTEGRQLAFKKYAERQRQENLREQSDKLPEVRKLISRLLQLGVDQEELHEMVRQCAIEQVHDS
jgi:hypothetical protein